MTQHCQQLMEQAYAAFNERNIDAALSIMHPQVRWANGREGGFVTGHKELRDYWARQWKEVNPKVHPVGFKERANGAIEVDVRQIAKDLQGNVLFDGMVKHIYTIEDEKIKTMEIEKPS